MLNDNGIFFTAYDFIHGGELWKTDGTVAGTVLVKDISPESASSSPTSITNANGVVFFTANDGIHGTELWKSDGTESGTVMIKDINPGSGSGVQQYISSQALANVKGTLYFIGNDGVHGNEVWKSDGSYTGTEMIKDINPGTASSNPSRVISVNGILVFGASDGIHAMSFGRVMVRKQELPC